MHKRNRNLQWSKWRLCSHSVLIRCNAVFLRTLHCLVDEHKYWGLLYQVDHVECTFAVISAIGQCWRSWRLIILPIRHHGIPITPSSFPFPLPPSDWDNLSMTLATFPSLNLTHPSLTSSLIKTFRWLLRTMVLAQLHTGIVLPWYPQQLTRDLGSYHHI